MSLTQRQADILNRIVKEYIKGAKPVSSRLLNKKYGLDVCPATIRIEMQKLSNKGYLLQPHTSAGRVPTDKGYRFFVDELFSPTGRGLSCDFAANFKQIKKEMRDSLRFVQALTKSLASISSNLAMGYLSERDFFWKEGWENLFQEPEFKDFDLSLRFVRMVSSLEKEIEGLVSDDLPALRVYIGKENPVSKTKDFSMIISSCSFPEAQKGALMILGPKRMSYQQNISLINSVVELLKDY